MVYNTEQLSLQPAKPPHGFLQRLADQERSALESNPNVATVVPMTPLQERR
jgi:hypothetical protein